MGAEGRKQEANRALEEGVSALSRGDNEGGLRAFERAVTLAPNSAEARAYLATAFARLQRRGEAEAAARAALELDSDNAKAAHLLGTLLCERDLWAAGLLWVRHALQRAPDNAQMWRDLGAIQLFLGHIEDARNSLLLAVELDPLAPEALFNVVRLVDMSKTSDMTARIDAVIATVRGKRDLPPIRRAELLYAEGKVAEDRKQGAKAFAAYAEGARLKRTTLSYDIGRFEARMEAVKAAFSSQRMAELKGGGVSGRRPIFIFGMPRSGTTLVEQIIAAHPQVQAAGETSAMIDMVAGSRGPAGAEFPTWVRGMTPADCANLGNEYLRRLPPLQLGRLAVTDKRLENFEYAGLIEVLFGDAVMISCRRDPRDNGWACLSMLFSSDQLFSYDQAELGRYWKAYDQLMTHWDEVLTPGRLLKVSYEAIVAEPETSARRIVAHAGLDWDDACLAFHTSKRTVRSASAAQVREPIYTRSVGRWRPFAEHLKPMFEAMGLKDD